MFDIFLTQYNGAILGPVAKLLGYIMNSLYNFLDIFGIKNAGLSIILFTFIVNGLMIPLTIKQQKFSKMSAKMSPELTKIQSKYKGKKDEASIRNQQIETKAIYEKYGTSPTGGCLPMLVTFPIILALYRVIQNIPAYVGSIKVIYEGVASAIQATEGFASTLVTYIAGQKDAIDAAVTISTKGWGDISGALASTDPHSINHIIDILSQFGSTQWALLAKDFAGGTADIINAAAAEIGHINSFLGMNIADAPKLLNYSVLIPILAVATQFLQTKLMTPPSTDENNPTAGTMKTMNTVMPFISGVFCLMLPIGIGIYWVAGSVFRIIQQLFVDKYLDNVSIDKVIEKNVEKTNRKKEKKGIDPNAAMKQLAQQKKSSIGNKAQNVTKSIKKTNVPSDYKREDISYEKGSIASIANMMGKNSGKNSVSSKEKEDS